jgi:nucleotide-binding universal stress UspA family protein
MRIEDVLVAVDFSQNSLRAIEFALSLVGRDGEVYLLHVIDSDFAERISQEGFDEVDLEELIFGSTAEKVVRASRIPVICVPDVV